MKTKQPELLSVEKDSVGNAAEVFLIKKEKLEKAKDDYDGAQLKLLEELHTAKRLTITLDGVKMSITISAAKERIKVVA